MDKMLFIVNKYIKSRKTVFFASIMLLAAILLSTLLVAAEADHDCEGDGCPVCACIHQCENCLSLLSGGCAAVFSFVFFYDFVIFIKNAAADILESVTLITQKVRLND
ncbi:MAG: hypothetical protein J6A07_00730 [Firmicutes bacterium]|nr:hypothetical protein [Bacillota bacterium]